MNVKRGNYKRFAIAVKDSAGDVVTDLATADGIVFFVKTNKTDLDADAVITKAKADMDATQLAAGTIDLTLSSTDTDIAPGSYYVGIQIDYGATGNIEIDLLEDGRGATSFTVTQDIVRG